VVSSRIADAIAVVEKRQAKSDFRAGRATG